jgi:hypothetical protein
VVGERSGTARGEQTAANPDFAHSLFPRPRLALVQVGSFDIPSTSPTHDRTCETSMITHATLYTLANALGTMAMVTVVAYHFVAVNARYLTAKSA